MAAVCVKKMNRLRTRLKEYEDRSVPRELELMMKESERARQLDGQVQALTAALIDGDEVVEQLRSHPKFLTNAQWEYLQQAYGWECTRMLRTAWPCGFPRLTPADNQALSPHPAGIQQCTDSRFHCRIFLFRIPAEVPSEEADDTGGGRTVCRRGNVGDDCWKYSNKKQVMSSVS